MRLYQGFAFSAFLIVMATSAFGATRYLPDCLADDATDELKIEACTFALQTETPSAQDRVLALIERAKSYGRVWHVDFARDDLREAQRLAPNDPAVIAVVAESSPIFLGKEKARVDAANQQLAAANPQDTAALARLGRAALMAKDYPAAEKYFSQVVAINPKLVEGWTSLAMVHGAQAQFEKAIDDHSHAVALAPDNPSLRFGRGESELFAGRYKPAIADFDIAFAGDKLEDFHRLRGVAKYLTGDFQGASADFDHDMAGAPVLAYLAAWRFLGAYHDGQTDTAELSVLAAQTGDEWTGGILRMMAKQGSLDQALALAGGADAVLQKVEVSQTHCLAGEMAMIAADKATAKAEFTACQQPGLVSDRGYSAAGGFTYPRDNAVEIVIARARLQELSQ